MKNFIVQIKTSGIALFFKINIAVSLFLIPRKESYDK